MLVYMEILIGTLVLGECQKMSTGQRRPEGVMGMHQAKKMHLQFLFLSHCCGLCPFCMALEGGRLSMGLCHIPSYVGLYGHLGAVASELLAIF